MTNFDICSEKISDGRTVRNACVEREVVAHAVRYGGACHGDGHACNCRGEHEFFVQTCINRRGILRGILRGGIVRSDRGNKRFFAFSPELETVFRTHAVEHVRVDVQDAFDHMRERIDGGVHNQLLFGGGEVFSVNEGEHGENAVRDALL